MRRPFHPILFALYPVLALYAVNTALVPPNDVPVPLAINLIATLFLWGFLSLVLRSVPRGAAGASRLDDGARARGRAPEAPGGQHRHLEIPLNGQKQRPVIERHAGQRRRRRQRQIRRARLRSDRPASGSLLIRTIPALAISPAMARSKVVLPAPFGPTRATNSPAPSASEMSSSTLRPPRSTLRPSRCNSSRRNSPTDGTWVGTSLMAALPRSSPGRWRRARESRERRGRP